MPKVLTRKEGGRVHVRTVGLAILKHKHRQEAGMCVCVCVSQVFVYGGLPASGFEKRFAVSARHRSQNSFSLGEKQV